MINHNNQDTSLILYFIIYIKLSKHVSNSDYQYKNNQTNRL